MNEVVAHYERQLPRKENYTKKTLAYLKGKEKELSRFAGMFRELLARPGRSVWSGRRFSDDGTSQAMAAMYEDHRQAVLRAIEAKTGKTA